MGVDSQETCVASHAFGSTSLMRQLLLQERLMSVFYFIPQAPTLALTSSRKDVKQLVFFQILQNADNIFYSVIILL